MRKPRHYNYHFGVVRTSFGLKYIELPVEL